MSVGPAPDQLAASAPASTRAAQELRRLGEQGGAGRLVDAVVRRLAARATPGSARPATSRPMRPRLNTASARGERLGEHAAGLGRGQVALGDDDDEGQLVARAAAARARARPSTVVAATQAAEHAGRRVLGMPVVGGRDGEGILGAGGRGGRGGERGGGAQPAGDRDLRAHRHGEAVVPQHLGGDPGRQVRRVVEEAGSLALAVHAERRAPSSTSTLT